MTDVNVSEVKLLSSEAVIAEIKENHRGSDDNWVPTGEVQMSCEGKDYFVTLAGVRHPVRAPGIQSICKVMGMPESYFRKYPSPAEFVEHTRMLLPIKCGGRSLVRFAPNGELKGILPHNYQVMDDDQVMEVLSERVGNLTDIRGIKVRSGAWNGSNYLVIYGREVMQNDTIFPALSISNSENGTKPLTVGFGTYRFVCTNGSVHAVGVNSTFKWNHNTDFRRQGSRVESIFAQAESFMTQTVAAVARARSQRIDARAEVEALLKSHRISTTNYKHLVEGGIEADTRYDMFNLLTSTARPRNGIGLSDARLESAAHAYLLAA